MYLAVRLGGGSGYKAEGNIWGQAFGDWRTGKRQHPPGVRGDYVQARWPRPPSPDFKP